MKISRIKHENELNDKLKKLCRMAHEMAEKDFMNNWNNSIQALYETKIQLTGDEALTILSTQICDFCSRWILSLKAIADQDDTGYGKNDIAETIFSSIKEMLRLQKEESSKINLEKAPGS